MLYIIYIKVSYDFLTVDKAFIQSQIPWDSLNKVAHHYWLSISQLLTVDIIYLQDHGKPEMTPER